MNPSPLALIRYQAISAYVALNPPRGRRGPTLRQLAARPWTLPNGRQVRFSAETLRSWARRYRQGGLEALEDKARPRHGVRILNEPQIQMLCALKREVPERSLDRILLIANDMGLIEPGTLSRSTLHRVLQQHGLSQRPKSAANVTDLDRFEAEAPNDLWQSDMLAGPWLPDPAKPGKMRRTWLYAFIDDHSRFLLAGRFAFKGDLPALELVFRQAVRRYGLARRIYYDNGATYRSNHMRQVIAALGIHRLVFTTPYRPQGHGKIEAFNRLCKAAFIAEVRASSIQTLDELNTAFGAWVSRFYNQRLHTETGQTPRDRWRAGLDKVRHIDEAMLRRAFLWSSERKADKSGILSLFGRRYQVGAELCNRKVQLRYDPEHLDQIEVWRGGEFVERVRPFQVQPHRRPTSIDTEPETTDAPVADWLGHLTSEHHAERDHDPESDLRRELERRRDLDERVTDILRARLAPEVMDTATLRTWLDRFGPFEPEAVDRALDLALPTLGISQHIQQYLDLLLEIRDGGDA